MSDLLKENEVKDLAYLRTIAKEATQGVWEYEEAGSSRCSEPSCCSDYWDERVWGGGFVLLESHLLDPENAQHIAAFDPPTVLAMMDEIEELRTWKADALIAMTDIQKLGQAAGALPGERIIPSAIREIARLNDLLRDVLNTILNNEEEA